MEQPEVDLNDMALFVEVARARSFRGASKITGVPNSTLSRRISLLEKAIGLRLLHRTTRKLELTDAGQIYFERSQRIVDEARLAHEQLEGILMQPSGLLRLSLPADFAGTYLAPLIAEFTELYPAISFDLDLTQRRVDMVSEPFDLAIRIGELESSHLIARPLARLRFHLYASPQYLVRRGTPDAPEELAAHDCLRMAGAGTWSLSNGERQVEVAIGGRFNLNSLGVIRRLAALDTGIAMIPEEIVAAEVAAGHLAQVLPQWHGAPVTVYAVTETRLLPAKTQRFIDFLREKLKDN